jgi:hypothetical protein
LIAIFGEMHVVCLADGNTRITTNPIDQSALYGLLMRLRDLGMSDLGTVLFNIQDVTLPDADFFYEQLHACRYSIRTNLP